MRRRRGRESLVGFANAIEIPGAPVGDDPDGWLFKPVETSLAAHHRLICEALERTYTKRHGRLMLFLPPGSAKSTYASVVGPTYYMGKRPDARLILGSYGSDLARRHGRRARQIVQSPAYAALFGTSISASTKAADEWALSNGAEYLAGGILSGITGNRAHGITIDDPVRGREQAESPTIRNKTWDAYIDDLLTRLIPGGWVVLVETRWHEDDLAGRLLPKGYNGESGLILCNDGKYWEVLNLPAEAEHADDPLKRRVGEMLWPEWFDAEHWDQFRRNSRTWSSLFQQRPRPGEGGIFKEIWLRSRYNILPVSASVVVHSWDTAQKPEQINDPSVCTVWNLGRGVPGKYLRDVYRKRVDYPTLKRDVLNLAARDKPAAILIEDKSSGQSLIQELRSTTSLPIIAIEPLGDKLFRASEVSAMVEAGLMVLPEIAPWLTDFEGEFFGFPLSTNDDQVDSVTQFLKWVRDWSGRIDSVGTGRTWATATMDGQDVSTSTRGYGSVRSSGDSTGY